MKIRTYTGKRLDPTKITAAHLSIQDIAHSLSQQPMYGGHTHYLYSRAQHCYNLSRFAPAGYELSALLYLGWRAYCIDGVALDSAVLQGIIAKHYVKEPHKIATHWRDTPELEEVWKRLQRDEEAMLFNGPTMRAANGNAELWPVSTVTAEAKFIWIFNHYTDISDRLAHP